MIALDIDTLRSLVAISETGSFTKAAELVHRTQSAISMQMRRLEEQLDRQIFIREGRSNRMSEDGIRLLEHAKRIIRMNDETIRAFTHKEIMGRVHLGLPDDYADRLLPRVLASFKRVHPAAEITMVCQGSRDIAPQVAEGTLDIGIVTHSDIVNDRVIEKIVRREPVYWVAAQDFHIEEGKPISLAVGPTHCNWRQTAIRSLEAAGRPYHIDYVSSSGAALISAVLSGLAVTPIPESAMRPGLRILRDRDGFAPLADCEISMIRSPKADGPIVDALAHHIVTSLGNITEADERFH